MVRYRRTYDILIINSIIQEENRHNAGVIEYSFTDIYNIIRKWHPKVGKDTVQRHLNRMVQEQFLVRLPKEGRRYNRTLYVVSPRGHKLMEGIRVVETETQNG